MREDDVIFSEFDRDAPGIARHAIDFTGATMLNRSGSTCDAYVCTLQRRRVFVKRLKEEYRDNPLYRAAFDKEYDLGVSLTHPSLARYVGFGGDYIVMDFIEGDTLADLIKRHDPRLKDRKFVRRLLTELVDVIEYLHHRNVVHCDIKADNVIVSPYRNRPVSLIDLDKAYTPWLDSSHGNSKNYGCESCTDGTIDFRGFGKLASALGLKKVADVCRKENVSVESVKRELGNDSNHTWLWLKFGVPVLIVATLAGVLFFMPSDDKSNIVPVPARTQKAEVKKSETSTTPAVPETVHNEKTSDNRTKKTYTNKDVDEIVRKHYGPLYPRLEYLQALADDPKSSSEQLTTVIRTYVKDQMTAQGNIFKAINDRYNLTEPFEILPVLNTSDEWNRFMKLDAEINSLYSCEIKRRSNSQ